MGANFAPRLRGQVPVVPTHAGWKDAEVALKEALRDASPPDAAMYYKADQLRAPTIANGDPSVAAMLDLLEAAKPPSATFDKKAMVGMWTLDYTNDLPAVVRDEVARHVDDPVMDVSVVMSIGETGAMDMTATISLLSGKKRVTSWQSEIAQKELSPVFFVSDEGGVQMSAEVTYASNDLLVLRKDFEHLDQLLSSNGLPQSSSNTDVWRRIEQASSETQAVTGTSLWRYGLRYDLLREAQFEHQHISHPLAASLAGLAPLAAAQPASAFDSVVAMLQSWLVGGSVLILIFAAVIIAATANPLTKRREEAARMMKS